MTILSCTKDTSPEVMRYLLGFPTMTERHKLSKVKAFLRVMAVKHMLCILKLVKDLLLASREDQGG